MANATSLALFLGAIADVAIQSQRGGDLLGGSIAVVVSVMAKHNLTKFRDFERSDVLARDQRLMEELKADLQSLKPSG